MQEEATGIDDFNEEQARDYFKTSKSKFPQNPLRPLR
jgi:hypothetical protein